MMFGGGAKAYVCVEPVDMRKSIDGLSQLVAPLLAGDAFSGSALNSRCVSPVITEVLAAGAPR